MQDVSGTARMYPHPSANFSRSVPTLFPASACAALDPGITPSSVVVLASPGVPFLYRTLHSGQAVHSAALALARQLSAPWRVHPEPEGLGEGLYHPVK